MCFIEWKSIKNVLKVVSQNFSDVNEHFTSLLGWELIENVMHKSMTENMEKLPMDNSWLY